MFITGELSLTECTTPYMCKYGSHCDPPMTVSFLAQPKVQSAVTGNTKES